MFVKTRAVFNAGAGGVWVVGSHPQNILHLRRGRLYEPSVLYKYIAPMEQTRPVKDAIFVEKRRKPAPFAPAGQYVCIEKSYFHH